MKQIIHSAICLLVISSSSITMSQELKAKGGNIFIEETEPLISIKPLGRDQQMAEEKEQLATSIRKVPLPADSPVLGIVLATPKVQPLWTLMAGRTVGQELKSWGEKVNWTVIWNPPKDWSIPASATFSGDFITAASEVINTLASNGALVRAHFHELNRTMVVTGPGVVEQ